MIINDSIRVKNYKCFDTIGGGFDRIMPINVVIGKNNSGKSSLIDLVRYLIDLNEDFLKTGRDNKKAEVFISHKLTPKEIEFGFKNNTSGGPITGNHFDFGLGYVGKNYTYRLIPDKRKKDFVELEVKFEENLKKLIEDISTGIEKPFLNNIFCNITAERDISPEKNDEKLELKSNGIGATNYIQQIVNKTKFNSNLVEKKLLVELNKIINPDILLTRIVPQQNDSGDWEIFFEDEQNNRIALSKMGSGIKTVLLVLLNLIVRPEIENKKPDSYIFAFEELENNLHPSLQRRLYSYIKDFSEFYNIYFFLTTHSNVVIDSFGTYPNAQLIHINKDSINAKTKTVLSFQDNKRILKDLDVKASDLLQSNSIIWVEGPSDRNYLNRWLEILAPDLHEGLHYSIMFYGGRLLSNLTFDFNWFNKEIIPLLKINSNAYVLIDRDGKSVSTKLNETKKRIVKEIGKDNYWVTKGREIENYLSENTVHKWLKDNYKIHTSFTNDKDIKFEDNILKSSPNIKIKYSANKSGYSSEIGSFIDDNSLDVLDLRFRLKELIKKIKDWNTQ